MDNSVAKLKKWIDKNIVALAELLLSPAAFDRWTIERNRRGNRVKEYYPFAYVFAKGKSKEKYCVVRFSKSTFNLLAAGIQYVFWYHWLKERGYIPVIDIEYPYSYKQGRLGEANMWDWCFEQQITAKDAMTQKYVIATGYGFSPPDERKACLELNGDATDHFIHTRKENWREYYAAANRYVEPIWQLNETFKKEYARRIGHKLQGKRVLGVLLREEFSADVSTASNSVIEEVYSNHPDLPTVDEVLNIIENELGTWRYDLIFLSTMYEDSVIAFKKAFGDKVTVIDRERRSFKNAKKGEDFILSEEVLYERDLKNNYFKDVTVSYCAEIIALSKCDYFLGGPCSGSATALTMNGGKYEDIFILEDKRKIVRY